MRSVCFAELTHGQLEERELGEREVKQGAW